MARGNELTPVVYYMPREQPYATRDTVSGFSPASQSRTPGSNDHPHGSRGHAEIPALGFGTFRVNDAEVAEVLPEAIRLGFRHVDTAQAYRNEAAVGTAIKASGVPRAEMFLTTKVWVTNFGADRFMASVDESLAALGTDHVDLLLLHWPGGSDVPMADRIARLAEARNSGRARHIGVSNYSAAQMAEAVAQSRVPIVTNQVEYHPWLDQSPLRAAARETEISLTAYYGAADGRAATDPLLAEIGAAHGKTAAQVALRWLVQQPGVVALSKTAKVARLPENLALFDFALSEADVARILVLGSPAGRIADPPELAPAWD